MNASAKRRAAVLVGQTVEILCEGPSKTNPHRLSGRTRGNKIAVFEGEERLTGRLVNLEVERTTGYTLYGKVAAGG
ncbi:MAG: TRAM domain-containing protein [Verrucomicrobia bacterium]|nr:TRAM domain-containing protein [Verrucomicrobiota bacterium]